MASVDIDEWSMETLLNSYARHDDCWEIMKRDVVDLSSNGFDHRNWKFSRQVFCFYLLRRCILELRDRSHAVQWFSPFCLYLKHVRVVDREKVQIRRRSRFASVLKKLENEANKKQKIRNKKRTISRDHNNERGREKESQGIQILVLRWGLYKC